MQIWVVVVAAGSGARFGAAKQFARLGGATVLDHAIDVAAKGCDGVVAVVPADAAWTAPAGVRTAVGGETRSDSVRAGLAQVPDDADVIVVHDAARPLASSALFERVIQAVAEGDADAAVPAVTVVDTVKRVDAEGHVVHTVPRDGLVAVQTPQAFRASVLRAAHVPGGVDTDDAAIVERAGGRVVVVEGEPWNLKITEPLDLDVAGALLAAGVGR